MSYFRQNIAIDLGTSSVLVYLQNKGLVVKEPSLAAVKEGSSEIYAFGSEAAALMEKTSDEVQIVKPIRNGIISNYTAASAMMKYYMNKAVTNPLKKILKPDVIVCIPCETTNVEKRAVEQAALEAGARRVYLAYETLASAIGEGIDINKPSGILIADIGGGTTDIAVISYGGTVSSKSVKVGGYNFDEAIKVYVKKEYGLLIGDKTAEKIKKNICALSYGVKDESMEIRGSNIITGLPSERIVKTDDFVDCLIEAAMPILDGIHSVLEETPPELAADIFERGMNLTGGGAMICGLDELIRKSIGIDAAVSENPEECAVIGAASILEKEKKQINIK